MKNERKLFAFIMCVMLVGTGLTALATRTITDSTDSINNSIVTSNGGVYAVTFAGLQSACFANVTGGWTVTVPSVNITFTTTLTIPSNVTLQGQGSSTIFYLGNLANITMIQNIHHGTISGGLYLVGGNDTNIHLKDFVVNGNQYHQPKYISSNIGKGMRSILLTQVHNSSIENVVVKDSLNAGVYWLSSHNIYVNHYTAIRNGANWSAGMAGYSEASSPGGIWFGGCQNVTVSNSFFSEYWNHGLGFEIGYMTGSPWKEHWTSDVMVTNCYFEKGFSGIWMEHAANITISNCVFRNITRNDDVYTASANEPTAIFTSHTTKKILMNNCLIDRCGQRTTFNGTGIRLQGENSTVSNCVLRKIYGNGTLIFGKNCIFTNNILTDVTYFGIYADADSNNPGYFNPIITNNRVFNPGASGIEIKHDGGVSYGRKNPGGVVSGNIISSTKITDVPSGHNDGIHNYNVYNLTICNNAVQGFYHSYYQDGGFCVISNNVFDDAGNDAIYITGIPSASNRGGNTSILGNRLNKAGADAISYYYSNGLISNNNIYGCGGDGIQLESTAKNNSVIGNMIVGCAKGIREVAGGNFNRIFCNTCWDCSSAPVIDVDGGNSTWWVGVSNHYGFNVGSIG